MKTEGPHFSPGYGTANLVMTGNQRTEQGPGEEEGGVGEEGEDDVRICELFERAELGHPFGYRRDVNLLMDVICDRLSSRLCHRCVRQTSNPTCPRLAPSGSESCQCQKIDRTGPNLGRLVQGREQMTQTTSNRCASCNATLCNRASTRGTVSTTQNDLSIPINLRDVPLKPKEIDHPDLELLPCHSRRVRFLKNRATLEKKGQQGMAEKGRPFACSSIRYKPSTSHQLETERPYQPLAIDKTTPFGMFSTSNDQIEKPIYIKGTNPLLDKMKYELQNDEETKYEFAKMYQEHSTYSPVPSSVYVTPEEFENRTVGARRHTSASPVDLLRKRINFYNNGSRLSVGGDLKSNVWFDWQTKTAGNGASREIGGREGERKNGGLCEEKMEMDPSIHLQAVPSAKQTQTQTLDNPASSATEIFASQQEKQTDLQVPVIKATSPLGIVNDCRKIHADICTQTSKTSQESFRQQPFSLNMWTQTQSLPSGTESNRLLDQKTTPGHRPSQSHHSSDQDWSSISESDGEDALPLNPKNTVKFYKLSLKKLNKKLAGGRDASSSDSDEDVHPRVGRVLESSHVASTHSLSTTGGSSHTKLQDHGKATHARSFQFAHPVLRDVISLEEPRTTNPENTEEVKTEEREPDFLGCYHEFDLAAFFELHHLDVPVSLRKKRAKTVHRQSESNDQRSEQQMDLKKEEVKSDSNPKQIDERLDHVKIKRLPKPSPPPPKKKKPKFHQGALNRFDAKEGARRLSWREQAPINRKAQFFEVEANLAGETKASSEEKRKMSTTVPETSTVRRISLFERMALY